MSQLAVASPLTEEEFYKLPSVELLSYYTPIVARIMGVDLEKVSLEFSDMPSNVHGATSIASSRAVTSIYLNMKLPLGGCSGDYLLFVFAHELQHYIQWREGRLLSCSDLATGELQTCWEGELFEYEPNDMSTPWEVEADLVASKTMDTLVEMLEREEAAS